MSKPKIVRFDFGSFTGTSELQNKNKNNKEKEPDNLILVDAYWERQGMKIRFIPHQMGGIELTVVFVYEFNNSTHDKNKAAFELTFESPDTIFSKQESKIIIKGNDVKELKENGELVKDDGRPCYYYKIKDFSSDLSKIF